VGSSAVLTYGWVRSARPPAHAAKILAIDIFSGWPGLTRPTNLLVIPAKAGIQRGEVDLDEIRQRMESCRGNAEETAKSLKDTHVVLEKLSQLYRRFGPDERSVADRVISDWLLAKDENLRFDAAALIHELGISSAAPELKILMDRLTADSTPGAPFERQKAARILDSFKK
jgi:hypothetical protein